ncbi:TIGR03905 family TSCPD domain-containing protein [Clostridium sp. UBA4548]|uniref:TIGR03905 family TSCPD domain-containing protein n=1 Tax=Clostridium sp. UBA4548 TaxID=1946361 RepID=UPI0025BC64D6|nr:TIGR03905 family TSCPD domain-containing protein [Clostridium sp. UBA4548]
MEYTYKTTGCCATEINFQVEDDILKKVSFVKGCPGNTKGLASLLEGMEVKEVIKRLKGTPCKTETSCPDQLACALEELVLKIS